MNYVSDMSIRTKAFISTLLMLSFILFIYIFSFTQLYSQVKNDAFTDFKALLSIEHQTHDLMKENAVITAPQLNKVLQLAVHYYHLVEKTDHVINEQDEYKIASNILNLTKQYISETQKNAEKQSNKYIPNGHQQKLSMIAMQQYRYQMSRFIAQGFDIIEAEADKDLQSLLYYSLLSASAIFTVILILVMYGITLIINPLIMLRKSIENFQGKPTTTPSTGDEIKLLMQSFSEMRHEIKSKQKALQKALVAAEQANLSKSAFLSNISHELRTPMLGILGFAELGLNKFDSLNKQKLHKYFDRIHVSGSRLLLLLNNLLELSKLEAQNITFEFEKHSIILIINEVLAELDAMIDQANVSIILKYQGEVFDAQVDKARIHQVIYNLLSNALKFSPEKSQISIELLEEQTSIKISIKDQGVGIPMNELMTIFDRFVQSSNTNTGAGGTGLGLSICKEICDAHHAPVWAENIPLPEHGAKFIFILPKQHVITPMQQ